MPENLPYFGEILALSTAVVWSIAVILFKKAGETVHPIALNLFKNSLGLVLLIPTMIILGQGIVQHISFGHFLLLIASGVLGIGLSDTFFLKSLNMLGASRSAIVDCLYSPFIIGLSVIWIGERLSLLQTVGAVMIVTGVFAVSRERSSGEIERRNLLWGLFWGVMAMASLAVGIVMIKPLLEQYTVFWSMQLRLVGGIAFLLLVLLLHPGRKPIINSLFHTRGWRYMIPASFTGSYIATLLWLGGMKYTQASTASALNQTSNILIFIAAAIFLKEKINRQKLIGIGLGIPGVFLVIFG